MLVQVTSENKNAFRQLLPEALLEEFSWNENLYGFGLVEDEEHLPVGVLLFETVMEKDLEGAFRKIASLRWIFVEEEYRENDAGTSLFGELLNLLENTGVEAVRCDVPFGAEYNLLCNVLENFGFHFDLTEEFTVISPLSEFTKRPEFREKLEDYVKPLKEVPDKLFALSLSEMQHQVELENYFLSDQKEDYEQEVSSVIWQGEYPEGLFLVEKRGEKQLNVCFLGMTGEDNGKSVEQMMVCAGRIAQRKYGSDMSIRIHVQSDRSAALIGKLIPDAEPLLYRRGYFYL